MAMALLATSSGAFAQTGSLTINNHTGTLLDPVPCKFYPGMEAVSVSLLDPTACDLGANTPTVLANTYPSWLSVYAFSVGAGSVGWTYEASAPPVITPTAWSTVTDFIWTDVGFQYQCPAKCTSGTGTLSTVSFAAPAACSGTLSVIYWSDACHT